MIPTISADSIAGYFFVFWIGLAILFYLLIWCDRDAAFKRKWLPRSFIFQGVLFAAFVIFQMTHDPKREASPGTLVFFTLVVAVITYLNIKIHKVCGHCGATNRSRSLAPGKFCAKCGSPLDTSMS